MKFAHIRLTSLLTALVCFTLPWFSISCNGPDGTRVEISQSGFEAATGETTTLVNGQLPAPNQKAPEQFGEPPQPARLLMVHGVAILLATLGAVFLRSGNGRWIVVTLLSGLAAAMLIVQIAIGFPMLKDAPDDSVRFTLWYWLAIAASIVAPIASLCERVRLSPEPTEGDAALEHSELAAWDDDGLG